MNMRIAAKVIVVLLFMAAAGGVFAQAEEKKVEKLDIEKLDPNMKAKDPDADIMWYDILAFGIEGQGWTDNIAPYDRLPAKAKGLVPEEVWGLSKCAAGLSVRFVTDAKQMSAEWGGGHAMPHMAATGVSGLDLYVRWEGRWHFAGVGQPAGAGKQTQVKLISSGPGKMLEYRLYLPLYCGVTSVRIGVPPTAKIKKAPPETRKPIVFYGTSITQGGCASRPGMAYPAILGRQLDWPTINLGFSGNAQMQPAVVDLIAEIAAAVYVIDCLPNVSGEMVTERTGPLVRKLRQARPDTPIVLMENVTYQHAIVEAHFDHRYRTSNANFRVAYKRLLADGVKGLHYVEGDKLYGSDGEATVDGTHATDLGFMRMSEVLNPVLKPLVNSAKN